MSLLSERFINVFDNKEKEKYADTVWDMLQSSYKSIGGLKGSGFESKKDMINSIPFWKIAKKNSKIVAVSLYKDKSGRKRVASGTDGSKEGKEQFERMTREDMEQERAYVEVSSKSLTFIVKRLGSKLEKYIIKPEEAEKILKVKLVYPVPDTDPEVESHPNLKDFFYQRKLGEKLVTKIMIGTANTAI
jgi:hypothetical protein